MLYSTKWPAKLQRACYKKIREAMKAGEDLDYIVKMCEIHFPSIDEDMVFVWAETLAEDIY